MSALPGLLSWESVQERLKAIFPEGTPHRGYLTRDLAASTVFVALYIGAVEGREIWLGPKHVYRFSDDQAAMASDDERLEYSSQVMKAGGRAPGTQWYQDTTREPIRDETLREALVVVGAAIERQDIATTSSKPRYALQAGFAELFDPKLSGEKLDAAIGAWQSKTLNKGALARIAIVRRGAGAAGDSLSVTFPNGETRRMKPGPSSEITKAVIEVFAPRFMGEPAILFVSESGNKVVSRDDDLAKSIGLTIKADKDLPDIILVDLAPEHPLLVFAEVVATDGPINARRKKALEELANDAGFPLEHVAFLTAYLDRSRPSFKKTVDSLAWGSFAWFSAEPDHLMELSDGTRSQLQSRS
jgi:hypothetical protein